MWPLGVVHVAAIHLPHHTSPLQRRFHPSNSTNLSSSYVSRRPRWHFLIWWTTSSVALAPSASPSPRRLGFDGLARSLSSYLSSRILPPKRWCAIPTSIGSSSPIYGSAQTQNDMNAGLSGFKNAQITRILVGTCGLVSAIVSVQGSTRVYSLSFQKIVQRLELWRLVTAPFVFPSIPELFLGIYLMYFFRVFERQVGSTKYLFLLLFATVISTFFEVIALSLFKEVPGLSSITLSPGPYASIFSSFVFYFYDIPVSARMKLLGAEVSDKTFVYIAGVLLLFWSQLRSFIPGICGVMAGLLYRGDFFRLQQLTAPDGAIGQWAWRIRPFLSGIPSELIDKARYGRRNSSTQIREPQQNLAYADASDAQVSDDAIAKLVACGYNQSLATRALRTCRNDLATAKYYLRRQQHEP